MMVQDPASMQENLHFVEDENEQKIDLPDRARHMNSDAIDLASLGSFLSRPVLIHSITISEAAFTNFQLDPWSLFFLNPAIRRKIDNFAFMQSDLKLKVVVNASPFLYGAYMVSYRPHTTSLVAPPLTATVNSGMVDVNFNAALMLQSQTTNIMVLPQNNAAGEMTLPWIYHRNWLEVTSAADLATMGRLYIQEVVPLQSANDASSFSIDLQFYAWAENVDITGATSALSFQAKRKVKSKAKAALSPEKDEYNDGPVSRVASTVANVANALSSVPVIGDFAKATSMGASAVSKIANFFGFTNPPVIDNVAPMKNLPFHALSTPDLSEPVETLTLDPKNELSVDPSTIDISPVDELDIGYLVQKEALLHACYWTSSLGIGTTLFQSQVCPLLQHKITGAVFTRRFVPPVTYLTQKFSNWRGDLIFRVKAICSQYHKGRLVISWDPKADLSLLDEQAYTTSFTQIVDLAPDMDISIRIPYLQAAQWLRTETIQNGDPAVFAGRLNSFNATLQQSTFPFRQSGVFTNGCFNVKVLNRLSGPADISKIGLLIYVRAADNFEFSDPGDRNDLRLSPLVPQSKVVDTTVTSNLIVAGQASEPDPDAYLIYMGEVVKNLRVLFRRQTMERVISFANYEPFANGYREYFQYIFTKWPKLPGWTPCYSNYTLQVGSGTGTFSYVNPNPIAWMMPCYLGMRGHIRRSFNVVVGSTNLVQSVTVNRRADSGMPSVEQRVVATANTVEPLSLQQQRLTRVGSTGITSTISGYSLSNTQTQTGITVELPHYYRSKYVYCNPAVLYNGASIDESNRETYTLQAVVNLNDPNYDPPTIECYVGAGTDFNMFYFISTPVLYDLDNLPTPVE